MLFAVCLTKRLSNWIQDFNILSPAQKGFLPYDGVFENNFVLHQRIQLARAQGKDICLFSADIFNAFGSIPRNVLFDAVSKSGAGEAITDLIKDLYSENYTLYITEAGPFDKVLFTCGVKQGCPLSGLLFNLVIDFVIRSIPASENEHPLLAYADDIMLISSSPEIVYQRITILNNKAQNIGLKLNP